MPWTTKSIGNIMVNLLGVSALFSFFITTSRSYRLNNIHKIPWRLCSVSTSVGAQSNDNIKHPLLQPYKFGAPLKFNYETPLSIVLHNLIRECFVERSVYSPVNRFPLTHKSGECMGTTIEPNIENILSIGNRYPLVGDDKVNKRLEIPGSEFTIENENIMLEQIESELLSTLFPTSSAIKFNRCKMIIYEKGGYCDWQRDIVQTDNRRATLLVELKSKHKGGQIKVRHGTQEAKFDNTDTDNYTLWAAHCVNLERRVEEVTDGHRIMIQYDAIADDAIIDDDLSLNQYSWEQSLANNIVDRYISDYEPIAYQLTNADDIKILLFEKCKLDETITGLDTYFDNHHTKYLAIPFYHLYTNNVLLLEHLQSIDRELFDSIVKTKRYEVALSPITVFGEFGGDDISECVYDTSFEGHFTDPVTLWHRYSEDSNIDSFVMPSYAAELEKDGCEYIVSMRENVWQIARGDYNKNDNKVAEKGVVRYFQGVFVVRKIA